MIACSCEQSSCQPKSDPFPNIMKRMRRYQHEESSRESKKADRSPTRRHDTGQTRKQTKSSSSFRELTHRQPAAVPQNDSVSDQPSLSAGNQRSLLT